MVLAKTAPVAPATASPQGGIGASFDSPAMASLARWYSFVNFLISFWTIGNWSSRGCLGSRKTGGGLKKRDD
jgi:hypothetical protein